MCSDQLGLFRRQLEPKRGSEIPRLCSTSVPPNKVLKHSVDFGKFCLKTSELLLYVYALELYYNVHKKAFHAIKRESKCSVLSNAFYK